MANFKKEFEKVILAEGGWVNDKDDAGKETYLGISRRFNPKWSGWYIIDDIKKYCKANKIYSPAAINKRLKADKELTEKAKVLYKKEYWDRLELDDVPSQEIAHQMFDTAVNCGVINSIKMIQTVLGMTPNGCFTEALKINLMEYGKTN